MSDQTKLATSQRQKNGLPRLGSAEGGKPSLKTQVVAIPDRGVSVVLRKPSVGMVLDVQDQVGDVKEGDIRGGYESTVSLVARMLVEPELSEEELRAEIDEWSFEDWQTLQNAALTLAGLREEDVQTARAEFQGER